MPESLEYHNGVGTIVPITDEPDVCLIRGWIVGRFSPPWEHYSYDVPLSHGSVYQRSSARPRPLQFAVAAYSAAGRATVRTALGTLASQTNPDLGMGFLRHTNEAGIQRDIYCVYESGLETPEGQGGTKHERVVFTFRAFDPFWYDVIPYSNSYTIDSEAAPFLPILPVELADSTVFAGDSVSNDGDIEAWPVWTIDGPGVNLIIQDATNGVALELSYDIGVGGQVTIDTRPESLAPLTRKSVTNQDGVNLYEYMTADSALFPIERGITTMQFYLDGATADSAIAWQFRPARLAA